VDTQAGAQVRALKDSEKRQGRSSKRAKEIAARTFQKELRAARADQVRLAQLGPRHLVGPARWAAIRVSRAARQDP
jgi:hypothetical protein